MANDKPRKRKKLKIAAAVLLALIIYPAVTYITALTDPGAATFAARTADWMREMGAGPVVNAAENWWYTRHPPGNGVPAADSLPPVRSMGQAASASSSGPKSLPVAVNPLPGEGVWVPGASTPGGVVADYTTFIRPDSAHVSVVAGVALIDQSVTRTRLVAGTKEPGGMWPEGAKVPGNLRPSLLATFNSGFKFVDTAGGFYADGRVGKPLKDGVASLVIDGNGTVSVGQWGRDVTMTSDVVAVRQNLELVVDNARPVPGLTGNPAGQWGSASSQFQFTWRSGIGTDAAGRLIYVGGNHLTLSTLADALVQAGVVRGMELDIHTAMVSFNTYRPDVAGASPSALLPSMPSPADRYLAPDQRDFFAVTLRTVPGQRVT